jgi:hypothetical protein
MSQPHGAPPHDCCDANHVFVCLVTPEPRWCGTKLRESDSPAIMRYARGTGQEDVWTIIFALSRR